MLRRGLVFALTMFVCAACDKICLHGATPVEGSYWEGDRSMDLVAGGDPDRGVLVWDRVGGGPSQWVAGIADGAVVSKQQLGEGQRLAGELRIASHPEGHLVVGVSSLVPDEDVLGDSGIFGLRLDADGAARRSRFQISRGRARAPAVAFDGTGLVVAYDDMASTVVERLTTHGSPLTPQVVLGPRGSVIAAAAQGGVVWVAWAIRDGDAHQVVAVRLQDGLPIEPAPVIVRQGIDVAGGLHLAAGPGGVLLVARVGETRRHHAIPLRADGTIGAEVMLPDGALEVQVAAAGDGYVVARLRQLGRDFPAEGQVTLHFLAADGTSSSAAVVSGFEAAIAAGRTGATLYRTQQAKTDLDHGAETLDRLEVSPDGAASAALPIDVLPYEREESTRCEGGH